jgi:hypothetical protein
MNAAESQQASTQTAVGMKLDGECRVAAAGLDVSIVKAKAGQEFALAEFGEG